MEKWYKKGLKFHCTQCGKCCTGFPGYVWLNDQEIKALAEELKISEQEFIKKYTKSVKGRLSLKEKLPHYDCIFFKDKKCTVYKARPKQCRTYPFWNNVTCSKEAWEAEKQICEGIDHKDSNLYTEEEIDSLLS